MQKAITTHLQLVPMSPVSSQLCNVKPTSRLENAMTFESDSICTKMQLPTKPSKLTCIHTQTDPSAKVFKRSQTVLRFKQQCHPRQQLMITLYLPNTGIVG